MSSALTSEAKAGTCTVIVEQSTLETDKATSCPEGEGLTQVASSILVCNYDIFEDLLFLAGTGVGSVAHLCRKLQVPR